MPRSRKFSIYALLSIVALSAGLLIARVFGSTATLPSSSVTPTAVIIQAATAPTAPTAAPSATAEATSAPTVPPSPAPPTVLPTETLAPTPPPTAPPAPAPASSNVEYTVQKGDILKNIAQKHGVTVEEILAINQIPNPDSLNVGSVIHIPKK